MTCPNCFCFFYFACQTASRTILMTQDECCAYLLTAAMGMSSGLLSLSCRVRTVPVDAGQRTAVTWWRSFCIRAPGVGCTARHLAWCRFRIKLADFP